MNDGIVIAEDAIENPNADTICGLREAADFLEAHPELPAVYYAQVSLRSVYSAVDARETLTLLAEALGEQATETQYSNTVSVKGSFQGEVIVIAQASVRDLLGLPAEPTEYQPILPVEAVKKPDVCPDCRGTGTVKRSNGMLVRCGKCHGTRWAK